MAAIPPQAAPWRGIAADAIAFISYALAEALEARECVDAAAATGDASARGLTRCRRGRLANLPIVSVTAMITAFVTAA